MWRSFFLSCLLSLPLWAVEPVPKPVAETLRAAQAAETPEAILAVLDAHTGEGHALIDLMRGQAQLRRSDAGGDHLDAAATAFTAALSRDPNLRQAHLGLAQIAAQRNDWPAAIAACAKAINLADCNANELLFYANAAWQGRDWRLVQHLVTQGIVRFPDNDGFRRLELAGLVHGGRADEAHQAILALLDRHPDDGELWRHLAWSAQQIGDETQALAALEVALLAAPDDVTLRHRLGAQQYARGLPAAAVQTLAPLLTAPDRADAALVVLAARAAADSGDITQARAWLGAVPEAKRTRDHHLLAARLALRSGDSAAAVVAVTALVALGDSEPQILAWSAQVCEQAGDDARAEAFYAQAAATDHAVAAAANLRLAALYLRQDRREECVALLALHLAKHPDDAQARALQQRVTAQ